MSGATGGATGLRWPFGTGPEAVATVLSVVVITVVLLVLGPFNPTSGPGASSAPGVVPSDGPGATRPAGAGSTAPGSAASAAASAPASPVAWRSTADAIVAIDRRLIEARDALSSALSESTVSTAELVRQLRSMNGTLTTAEALVDALAETDAPEDLVTALQTRHRTAHDLVSETLQASVQNASAYQTGATAIVTELAPLEALISRVERAAGI